MKSSHTPQNYRRTKQTPSDIWNPQFRQLEILNIDKNESGFLKIT